MLLFRMKSAHQPVSLAVHGRLSVASVSPMKCLPATHYPLTTHSPLTTFRINTCKSVSKQRTLTPFRMNTYEKHRGVGVLLLTKHPMRMLILSERSEPKDLSSHPVRIAVLRSIFVSALSFAHQGRLACHAQPRPLFLHPRVGEAAPARVRLPLRDSLLPVNARHHGGVTIHVRGHLVVGDLLRVQRFALRRSQELRLVLQRSVVINVNQR